MSDTNPWKPIETAPKDGTPILACLGGECYTGHGFLPVSVRWTSFHPNAKGKECWRDSRGYKIDLIEFWMDLPPAP